MLTAPLFMALLSGPLLGEYPQGKTLLAVAVGFVGVLVMINPYSAPADSDLAGMLMVLAASVVYTLWMIQTRHLATTELAGTHGAVQRFGYRCCQRRGAAVLLAAGTVPRPVANAGGWWGWCRRWGIPCWYRHTALPRCMCSARSTTPR